MSGNSTTVSGKLYRMLTPNSNLPDFTGAVSYWTGNSTLISLNQPITAAPNVATDNERNLWVYFGTGRFFNKGDLQQSIMSFYGVKEPTMTTDGTKLYNWQEVAVDDLYDSTNVFLNSTCGGIYSKNCVSVNNYNGNGTSTSWDNFLTHISNNPGWVHDFTGWERNIGQAAVLGGTTLFTT